MKELTVLIRKELLEQARTKKLLILGIIFLFVALSSPILAKLTPEILKGVSMPGLTLNLPDPTYHDAIDQFIKNISQIALLVLVFVVAGAITDEKSKRTLEITLTKPVPRSRFIAAKFAAYFISVSAVLYAACLLFYGYTLSLFGSFSALHFLLMTTAVLVYLLAIVSLTLLASTVVRGTILAGGLGFLGFLVLSIVPGLVPKAAQYFPGWIISNYKTVIDSGWSAHLGISAGIAVLISLAAMVLAMRLFARQEIER